MSAVALPCLALLSTTAPHPCPPQPVLDSTAFDAASTGRPASAVVMLAEQGRRRSSCSTASRGSVSSAAEAGAAAFLGAGTCAFAGGQLLLLKPGSSGGGSGSGGVSELWAVDLTLPEERQAKAAAAKVVQQLTLECEEVGASSVRLAWRAPANNADKASFCLHCHMHCSVQVLSCWCCHVSGGLPPAHSPSVPPLYASHPHPSCSSPATS